VIAGPPPQERAAADGVTAALYYRHAAGTVTFSGFRVEIRRDGRVLLRQAVPAYPGSHDPMPARFALHRPSIAVRDLDGDGEPEVMLDLVWGGAHCCEWSRVYRYQDGRYVAGVHLWGNVTFELGDPDRDGRPEWVTADDRFAYAFTDYAESGFPLRLWSYRAGRFLDVTRSFLPQVRADAGRWWHFYLQVRGQRSRSVRGLLAAWAADEELLGNHRAVLDALDAARERGELAHGTVTDGRSPAAYVRALLAFLRRTGYIR
jgi:hypothetical protein